MLCITGEFLVENLLAQEHHQCTNKMLTIREKDVEKVLALCWWHVQHLLAHCEQPARIVIGYGIGLPDQGSWKTC